MRNIFVVLSLICCLNPCLTWAADNKPLENTEFQVFKAQTELKFETIKEIQQKAVVEIPIKVSQAIEAQGKTIDAFDKRIADLNLYIALASIIITVLAIFATFVGYSAAASKAKNIAEDWFTDNEKGLLARLKVLEDGVATHATHTKKTMTAKAEELKAEKEKIQNNMISGSQIGSPEYSSQLKIATEEITHKPSVEFTIDDWDTLAFNAINENKIALAIEYWGNAAQTQDADAEKVVRVLFNKAVALGRLDQSDEAIIIYKEIINGYDASVLHSMQVHVANALNCLGFRQLMRAKQVWADVSQRQILLNDALTLLRKGEAKPQDNKYHKAMLLGNLAYALWLLERTEVAVKPLREALQLGGEVVRAGELADAAMHTIDADAGFIALVEKLWAELQSNVAVGK